MGKDGIKLTGVVTIELRDEYGKLRDKFSKKNLIVSDGFDFICDVIGNTTQPADMQYTAIGTDNTAASLNQSQLIQELDRVANDYSHNTGETQYVATASFGPGVSGAVVESGLLNAANSGTGTMLNRQIFTAVNITSSDYLQVKWTIALSQ